MACLQEWMVVVMCVVVYSKDLVVQADTQITVDLITCWTCPNMTTNGECNGWAPDIKCPAEQTVCRTVHRFESASGSSVLVNKGCVAPSQCSKTHVGCRATDNRSLKECVSCCTESYCNKEVAVDNMTAMQLSLSVLNFASPLSSLAPGCLLVLMFLHYCVT
ncbi:ly6/PLAUR domain-containing protein 6-like [Haliotis rufescens]|uniref:ly6/PLAUR domain-containing protein 6-like n=1 Tax=Haliotis rufescens TaxID=6454 RepID=UPI001EB03DB6|nr:ly6/PLAUR domain-containing protein 6-like [Haliotis rufescens]XP_046377153.1 ly6/PLAUR domain-containing protein 6-like [Haliotis rufescens]XP_046377154.1 ly6/PLAUR domain-containing protein 6-like [Haliotis rufescens]